MRPDALAEFIRRHRVHYEVVPDVVAEPDARTTVGFVIRLFAIHDKGARALPGCVKCVDLLDGLRCLAQSLLPPEERSTLTTIEPFDPILYDSKEVPGADEVALALRLSHRDHYEQPVDACEERCLKEMRHRLKALGVRER